MSYLGEHPIIKWLTLVFLVFLWAGAYSLTRFALGSIAPIWVVVIRLWIGAVFLFAVCKILKKPIPSLENRKLWFALLAAGVVGSLLPFYLVALAQTKVPSALAPIYLSVTPLAAAILAHFFVPDSKLNIKSFLGVILGIWGVTILFIPGLSGHSLSDVPLWPQILLLTAAFCYGATLIIVRLVGNEIDPIVTSFGFVVTSAIVGLPIALISTGFTLPHFAIKDILAAIALGIGPTAIASIIYVRLVHDIGPVMVANVSNLVPFAGALLGYLIFDETLAPSSGIALIIILLGVFLLQKSRAKTRVRPH